MNILRVLMVNKFHYLKGGSETYHFSVAEGLEQAGCEVAFFSMEDPNNLPCRQSQHFVSPTDYNGKTGTLRKIKDGLSLIYSFEAKRKFQALLEEFQPDVIHMNLVHRQLTFSILDASWLRTHIVPMVYTAHDYIAVCPNCTMLDDRGVVCDDCLSGSFKSCYKKRCVKGSRAKSALAAAEARFLRVHDSYQKIDRIIAPSEFMKNKLCEGGFPLERIDYMQNFASYKVLKSAQHSEDCTDYKNPYLIYFGRLSKEKGIDILLSAFLRALPRIPDNWRLVIVGDGPEKDVLREMIQNTEKSVAERIVLAGFQEGDNLRKHVEGASLAIASSRWRENMPYSIIEAFALGTPVIGTRIGGIPELVKPNETGFLCEPGDEGSLAEAIVRASSLCTDKQGYYQMQKNCREYVLSRCSQEKYIDSLIELYKQLIENKRGVL